MRFDLLFGILRSRFWLVASIVAITTLMAITGSLLMSKRYSAATTVYVDANTVDQVSGMAAPTRETIRMAGPENRGNMEYQARVVADLLNIQRHNGDGIGGIGEFIHDDDISNEYSSWIHGCFDEKNKLNIGKFQAHVTHYFEYYKANPKLNNMQLGKVNPDYNWNWELILRSMGVNF